MILYPRQHSVGVLVLAVCVADVSIYGHSWVLSLDLSLNPYVVVITFMLFSLDIMLRPTNNTGSEGVT